MPVSQGLGPGPRRPDLQGGGEADVHGNAAPAVRLLQVHKKENKGNIGGGGGYDGGAEDGGRL